MEPRAFLFATTVWEKLLCSSATQMFQFPSLIAMTIAATQMYRSLSDFVFGSTGADMYYFPLLFFLSCAHSCRQLHSFSNAGGPQRHGISTTKFNNPASIQLNRIEVAVEVDCEQHQSTSSADSQLDNKLHQLKFGGDLESAMGEPSSKIDY